ncbi:hypothetical protein DASC09_036710 [Saccharomycopsis crataegensis]|uniref:SWIRM domain-containing protein n=1 Tax=Saccharomycopsis crataegensis TaxID=43959 RepID=A0AAV5QP53_9ASCO|nr:hypothetical protein DASC09_036710 [Saccharomycopsis crataegensis]
MSLIHASIDFQPILTKGKAVYPEEEKNDNNSNQVIPSPPLSPSKTPTSIDNSSICETPQPSITTCVKPQTPTPQKDNDLKPPQSSYPMASLKDFSFKVNAWEKIHDSNYLSNCSSFLNQYYILSSRKELVAPRREIRKNIPATSNTSSKRKCYREYTSDSFSDSGNGYERVRTRRITKERNGNGSANEASIANNSDIDAINSPPPKKRKVRDPSTPKPSFVDWKSIPDYSPNISTLPANNTRCLSTEWKGQPMNLSDDPLVDKLHPAEVTLASILRLPCNVYLDSKRRLFVEKVTRLKKHLPFRRTDAQKACRIDVNKASRLFAAFEKAGWLNDHHFKKFT